MFLLYVATTVSILIIFLFLTIYLYSRHKYHHWQSRNLPHVPAKFPVGSLKLEESTAIGLKRLYQELRCRGWKHGGLWLGPLPVYCVTDLELIKRILVNDFVSFPYRGTYVNPEIDPYSDIIIDSRGEKWRRMKSIFLSAVTGSNFKIIFNILQENLANFDKIFDNLLSQSGHVIKGEEVVDCLLLDYLADYAFGLKINSFNKSRKNIFKHHIEHCTDYNSPITRLGLLVKLLFPNLSRRLGLSAVPKTDGDYFLQGIKNTLQIREKNKIVRQDLLQLLQEMKTQNKIYDIPEIAGVCLSFLGGALETSSATISFALYELARNPEIQEKLRQEVGESFGKYGEISYESIQDLPYLDQVISETLRKYPPFPFIVRKTAKKYKLDVGELDEGTLMMISVWGLHFDEEYYPEPEKFDPERFSDENKKCRTKFSYLPFGDGPRRCLGDRLATAQIRAILSYFLRNYRFSVNEKTETPFKYQDTQALKIHGGIWLNVEKV